MRAFRDSYLTEMRTRPLRILDVGSASVNGVGSYRDLLATSHWQYVGLDVKTGLNVDVVADDPYRWKELPDASFDVVVSGQAFEHIEWPWLTMQEIARVLKPNGLAAITAPSSGRVHRYPTDCWRYYPDGLPALAKYTHLSVVENEVDFSGVFKECAEWGDAFAVLQKPPGDAASPFESCMTSRGAIAKCAEAESKIPASFAWRWKLARRHFRTAFRALLDPHGISRS